MDFQPNPLNTHNLRVVGHCPPHFYAVDFNLCCRPKKISDWIYENLHGRFFFGDVVTHDSNSSRSMQIQKRAAFEIHSEASYFALMLSEINKF